MSKAIFFGDNYYSWVGIKNILRGTSIYYGMQYYATNLPSARFLRSRIMITLLFIPNQRIF